MRIKPVQRTLTVKEVRSSQRLLVPAARVLLAPKDAFKGVSLPFSMGTVTRGSILL